MNRILKLASSFAALAAVCWLAASCPVDPQHALLVSGRIDVSVPQGASGLAFISSFGGKGSENGQFDRIGGLAAGDGKLYVCDQQRARVQVFDYTGKFLASWGDNLDVKAFGVDVSQLEAKPKAAEDELMTPMVVQDIKDRKFFRPFDAAMYRGNVLVLNNFHSRAETRKAIMTPELLEFTPAGELVRIHDIGSLLPTFLAVDQGNSRAIVSDVMNNAFEVYDLANNQRISSSARSLKSNYDDFLAFIGKQSSPEGKAALTDEWTGKGSKNGQFSYINGVAFYNGMVLAVDYNNDRIQVFDEASGTFLRAVVGQGPGMPVLFSNPMDIAVDKNGLVYVCDANPNNPGVMILSSKFKPISKLMHPDMRAPAYIELSSDGHVFISDGLANQVFIYGPKKEALAAGQKAAQGGGSQ
jgi:hypothetical protein